jgi:hypothetical protein
LAAAEVGAESGAGAAVCACKLAAGICGRLAWRRILTREAPGCLGFRYLLPCELFGTLACRSLLGTLLRLALLRTLLLSQLLTGQLLGTTLFC